MTDWDKRVEEASEKYASVWTREYRAETGHAGELAFSAGANWAREEAEAYGAAADEAEAQVEQLTKMYTALQQQCEAMAEALEYARNCVGNFNIINLEAKAAESKLNEALAAYNKFKEGG